MSGVKLTVHSLTRFHQKGEKHISVLNDVNININANERVAIVGPSGSGKSTFLHAVGLLERPSSGTVLLDDQSIWDLSESKRAHIRNRRIGFVFQSHNLLPEHTAVGNVMMPPLLAGCSRKSAEERAITFLRAVGLGHRLSHRPGELSGGEQQRVALARALVMGPGLVLADEPTGNLDPKTAQGVFELMLQLNDQLGSTLIVVTHSLELAARFERVFTVTDGKLVESPS